MSTTRLLKADAEFCDGCRMCEIVCSLRKAGMVNPYLARLRVARSEDGIPRPTICRHCKVAKCQLACPEPGAFYEHQGTGALVIDESKCTRCLKCVEACPFAAMWVGPGGEVLKCDLCDGDPVCVKHCPYTPENSLPHLPYPRQSCLKYVVRRA